MQLTTIFTTALFAFQAHAAVNGRCAGSANVRGYASISSKSYLVFDSPGLTVHVLELN